MILDGELPDRRAVLPRPSRRLGGPSRRWSSHRRPGQSGGGLRRPRQLERRHRDRPLDRAGRTQQLVPVSGRIPGLDGIRDGDRGQQRGPYFGVGRRWTRSGARARAVADRLSNARRVGHAQHNVTWQDANISRASRWRALDARGATVWLTGLPASGKSTLGAALEERLVLSRAGSPTCWTATTSATGSAATLASTRPTGRATSCASASWRGCSPTPARSRSWRSCRRWPPPGTRFAPSTTRGGLRFIEVFLDTPLAECAARDPKHLYARARAGELADLTGVDQPYERPEEPEVTVEPGTALARRGRQAILASLDVTSHQRNGVKR